MSNVVQFLEALARDPKTLSAEDVVAAIATADLEPVARQALLGGDVSALNQALGARGTVLCFVVPAENDEPDQQDDDQGDEQAPEQEASSRAA